MPRDPTRAANEPSSVTRWRRSPTAPRKCSAILRRPSPRRSSRTPLEITGHLGDLLEWAVALAQGEWTWKPASTGAWDGDVERFFAALAKLDTRLAAPEPLGHTERVIFQGPIADALTHVGQLAMLRRLAGSAVRPESFARADITAGRVGRAQSTTRREFDGDASKKR